MPGYSFSIVNNTLFINRKGQKVTRSTDLIKVPPTILSELPLDLFNPHKSICFSTTFDSNSPLTESWFSKLPVSILV